MYIPGKITIYRNADAGGAAGSAGAAGADVAEGGDPGAGGAAAPQGPAPTDGAPAAQPNGETWYSGFDESLQSIVQKNGWSDKGPDAVVHAYGELQTLLGNRDMKGYVKLPGEGEKWDDVWSALGRPEEAGGYENIQPPEGHMENDPTASEFKEAAYQMGLNGDQYKGVVDWYYNTLTPMLTEMADKAYDDDVTAAENALRAEFGAKYAEKIAEGNAAMNALGWSEDTVADLNQVLGAENVSRMLLQLAPLLNSDSGPMYNASGSDSRSGQKSATWAQQEIDTLRNDKEFMGAIANNTLDEPKWHRHIERWNEANAVLQGG